MLHTCMSVQVIVGSQQHSAIPPPEFQRFSMCDVYPCVKHRW